MKKSVKKIAGFFALPALCIAIFAFSFPFGGEGFEIYINNKLVMQQFGKEMNSVKTLDLGKQALNSEVTVKYFHCGQPGKNRAISIRNGQGKILKTWNFADGAVMKFSLAEIPNPDKKDADTALTLYYTCGEKPGGQKLVNISNTGSNLAKK
jgi:hypothetical protein